IEPPQHKQATRSPKPTLRRAPAAQTQAAPTSSPKPLQIAPATAPVEVKLRTPLESADPGGTIDHTAQSGETYRYTARRVRTVSLGGHTLEVRSSVSPPVIVAMRDTFPPQVPSGLEAVPGGATQ